jgi:hypothetical protein
MLLLTSSGAALSFVDTRPANARASEWVEAMGDALPRTLDGLSAYPLAYRKAAFRELTAAERSAAWREQLDAFRGNHELSKAQDDFLNRLGAALSPDLYAAVETKGSTAADTTVGPLCVEAATLFTEGQRHELGILGPVPEPPSKVRVWLTVAARSFQTTVLRAGPTTFHDCDCSEDTYCPECDYLVEGCDFGSLPECSETWFGCGCGWAFWCTGFCVPIVAEN